MELTPLSAAEELLPADRSDGGLLKTIDRACSVLLAFLEREEWTVTELAKHGGWDSSVTSRTVMTLRECKFLERDSTTRRYRLGSAVPALAGTIGRSSHALLRAVENAFERLAVSIDETLLFFVPNGADAVCLKHREGRFQLRYTSVPGSRTPGYAGAGGRAVFAHFSDEDRRRLFRTGTFERFTDATIQSFDVLEDAFAATRLVGFAVSHGEYDEHVCSVAASVFSQGYVIGSITIVGVAGRVSSELDRYIELLLTVAQEIEQHIDAEYIEGIAP